MGHVGHSDLGSRSLHNGQAHVGYPAGHVGAAPSSVDDQVRPNLFAVPEPDSGHPRPAPGARHRRP